MSKTQKGQAKILKRKRSGTQKIIKLVSLLAMRQSMDKSQKSRH